MKAVHPQYITDNKGKRISVVIPLKEFEDIMEELEDVDDIKLYDQAKADDNGERISFDQYLLNRKENG